MQQYNSNNYTLDTFQSYIDLNDLLYKLDIQKTFYPTALCKFAKMISRKYKKKYDSELCNKVLYFLVKIEKDFKGKDLKEVSFEAIQSKYGKEYQEMIDSLN